MSDSVVIGHGTINKINVTLAVHDFQFMGGSLGMAAGEAIITAIKHSLENNYPFILCASSGGARMQEEFFINANAKNYNYDTNFKREENSLYSFID